MSKWYHDFFSYINKHHLGVTLPDEDLKKYCTLKIGGRCYCVYKPNSIESLVKAYKFIIANKLEYYVIGNGSNLLISDEYHFKIFIYLKGLNTITLEDNLLNVDAGVMGNVLSKRISELGLSGLEFLAGIPATIGGMIYMNAGSNNKSISDVLESITYIDELGKICKMTDIPLKGFGYRMSPFMKRKVIILSCTINLKKDLSSIHLYYDYLEKKVNTQPLKDHSAGCIFKNPNGVSAWKLIKEAKSIDQINDAGISDIHANFFINKKNATYNDFKKLIETIRQDVYEKYKILLESEITIVE